MPLRLLLEQPPAPQDWLTRRSGYVAFGHGYAEQASLAEENGWEVRRLDGGHLHLLTAPEEVAETLLEVVERLSLSRQVRLAAERLTPMSARIAARS